MPRNKNTWRFQQENGFFTIGSSETTVSPNRSRAARACSSDLGQVDTSDAGTEPREANAGPTKWRSGGHYPHQLDI